MTKKILFKIPENLSRDLSEFCKDNELSLSQAIRNAIKQYIKSENSPDLPRHIITFTARLKGLKTLENMRDSI